MPDVNSDPDLRSDLQFLDQVLNADLDDFAELWLDADEYPQFDWTNDGCSDRNAVTAGDFGCIRHDFLYRSQKRIDADNKLSGRLTSNNGSLKNAADHALRQDVGGLRGWAVFTGVHFFGGGFYGSFDEDRFNTLTTISPYGSDSNVVRPGSLDGHLVTDWLRKVVDQTTPRPWAPG